MSGKTVPTDITLKYCTFDPATALPNYACGKPKAISSQDFFKDKKVVLFAVPGAFTPTCHNTHLSDYLKKASELKSKGVDVIACLSTADAYVMDAWGKMSGVKDEIVMLADGNGEWVTALGLNQDLSSSGMGACRSKRFAMIIDKGIITYLGVDDKGVQQSGVDAILQLL